MKNIDLPVRSDDPNLQFELETPSNFDAALDSSSNMSYGLNIRQIPKEKTGDDNDGGTRDEQQQQQQQRNVPVEDFLLQKLKDDLSRLPEDRGFEEFTDVPVEGFGAALLAGYGWYEGRGIGKNNKEDVKIVQYQKRTAKEGLGFVSDMHVPTPNTNGSEGGKDGDKLMDRGGLSVGNHVRIVEGRHAGVRGRIVEILDGSQVVLKLSRSNEKVNVRSKDIAVLGSKEEEKCLKERKELKNGGGKAFDDKMHYRQSREAVKRTYKDNGSEIRGGKHKTSQVSWLTSHIRVRIISKGLNGGRLYLKKGRVVDVVGPTTCDISIDENRELVQGVSQDLLETALPRRGGPVLVLYGKHKGTYGNLVERDLEAETGVIQDADNHGLLTVRLEQIAEYIGDPSDIGY